MDSSRDYMAQDLANQNQNSFTWLVGGGVTSPSGFLAGASYGEIKNYGDEPRFDVGILAGDKNCTTAGMFTKSSVTGWTVQRSKKLLEERTLFRGVVVNSGNANTMTGAQGKLDANEMASLASAALETDADFILNASTGVIGRAMPMNKIKVAIDAIEMHHDGGDDFARSIMTTDTTTKQCAVKFTVGDVEYVVGGCAKGSGMIHPNMATMLAFLTTNASVHPEWLKTTLVANVDRTFNMLDIDMDTSTSDTVLLFASNTVGEQITSDEHPAAELLSRAIFEVCRELVRNIAFDGEGATVMIEVVAKEAASENDAKLVAKTIASSPLIKTMVTGKDPNWGRILMAAGRSGAEVDPDLLYVEIAGTGVFERGSPLDIDLDQLSAKMDTEELKIEISLGKGVFEATAWGCNLTKEYVSINADYTT
ncbi:MAG: bifunctional glutamate N-acetyltransferase/amino-acid acetyltransferase ArgJ [Dehalococcoidia bacterium]|nr:bifunctional glutamate N-acetyltransferase/amino-acid acetyltransferase ArgJ [Dehalococcoidia bacterium]